LIDVIVEGVVLDGVVAAVVVAVVAAVVPVEALVDSLLDELPQPEATKALAVRVSAARCVNNILRSLPTVGLKLLFLVRFYRLKHRFCARAALSGEEEIS
jgi:hypothetical protein